MPTRRSEDREESGVPYSACHRLARGALLIRLKWPSPEPKCPEIGGIFEGFSADFPRACKASSPKWRS
jgi:hypothetical protein